MTEIPRLPRSLSSLETWGFGLTGLLLWLGVAPEMHVDLGAQVVWVWVPGVCIGVLINLQVKQLAQHWPHLAGGTPSYIVQLLPRAQWLGTYAALGYFISWVAVLPVNAIVMTELITANLGSFGITVPAIAMKLGFTGLAFVVAFSGTRALGILHLFFVIPAVLLLLMFCLQGNFWLLLFPPNPGFNWTTLVTGFDLGGWAKWYIIATYAVYACETASSFVADSRRPKQTLGALSVAAGLMPIVYLGGSWVLLRLAQSPQADSNAYFELLSAAPFWGDLAPLLITFLIASGCLLACATAVSNTPRMLYQLGLAGHISPVFAVSSRQGVLAPGLLLTLGLSVACLLWGDIARIVMVTGVGWLFSFVVLHGALWVQRRQPQVRWPWLSLGFATIEAIALGIGGFAWGWPDLLLGLGLPGFIGLGDRLLGYLPIGIMQPQWWLARFNTRQYSQRDVLLSQVVGIITLIGGSITASWLLRGQLTGMADLMSTNLFVVVLLVAAFVGVAIACWTTLPQVTALAEARKQAESFLDLAADCILVLDEQGNIRRANVAAETLFDSPVVTLQGCALTDWIPDLSGLPETWADRSEHTITLSTQSKTVELTISRQLPPAVTDPQVIQGQYVAILRDITQRKRAEDALRQKSTELKTLLDQLTQTQSQLIQAEKMSSLGQLMAGVAHEINNPVSFIFGNVQFVRDYVNHLLTLVHLYRCTYPVPTAEIEDLSAQVDIDFVQQDLPKVLMSMDDGANRIKDIVLSLRNFARQDLKPTKSVDIHEGLNSTLLILQNRLKAQSDRDQILITKAFGKIPTIACYPSQLNQVFLNLLGNAIDALEDKQAQEPTFQPAIAIQTTTASEADQTYVVIRISDNGSGIPEAIRNRLFDPFFTTKPVGKGTGLGLSISYQIITERHQGQIWVESVPQQGTTFVIRLPVVAVGVESVAARSDG